MQPFHLAIPVRDLTETRAFYAEALGCPEGRSSDRWVDFDLFGHQLVIHRTGDAGRDGGEGGGEIGGETGGSLAGHNPVDGQQVPVPHFGVVLEWDQWNAFAERLQKAGVEFVIEPCVRFEGQVGEQATMFFKDPSGNALEFKAFRDPDQLFAT